MTYRRGSTPGGNGGNHQRKRLADMTPDELRQWLAIRRQRLIDHKAFVQDYLDRRSDRRKRRGGQPTRTDQEYTAFQDLADDLITLLDEALGTIDDYEENQP